VQKWPQISLNSKQKYKAVLPKLQLIVNKKVRKWLNSRQKDRAVLPNPKLIVKIGRLQKMFYKLILTPKIAPTVKKKRAREASNVGQSKTIC